MSTPRADRRASRRASRRAARRPGRPTPLRVLAAASLAAGLLTSAPAVAHAAGEGGPSRHGVSRPAADLWHSVGVAVHLAYADTPYADSRAVADALSDLGIRHVRDDLMLDEAGAAIPAQVTALGRLADRGIRATLITGNPGRAINGNPGAHPVERYTDALAASPDLLRATEAIEGTNEWDVFSQAWGDPDTWPEDTVARQVDLLAAVAADPSLAALPVLSPSLAFGQGGTADLRAAARQAGTSLGTVANAHFYTGGWKPSGTHWSVEDMVRTTSTLVPDAPLMVTETGYHNATSSRTSHPPVPERVAATYLTRLPAVQLKAGVTRSYLYELWDQGPSARSRPEQSFGLLRHDGTPKPAYRGLRALLRLVEDDGDPRRGRLRYRVRGAQEGTEQLLLRKSDGRFVLLLWRSDDIWDPATRMPRRAAPDRLTVVLPQRRAVRVYEPTTGCGDPVARGTQRRVRLRVDGSVTAVVIGGRARADLARPLPACRR